MNEQDWIEKLWQARLGAKAIEPITSVDPDFDLKKAYAIQEGLLSRDLKQGNKLSGYKMGLTSLAKQRDVNVFEPIRGYLLDSMKLSQADGLSTKHRIHPRVEPEIVVVLKEDLKGPNVNLAQVEKAVSHIFAGCEILDSRYHGYKFALPDVVADNTSASGYFVGSTNLVEKHSELNSFKVSIKKNGEELQTGSPEAVLGNPLKAVVELVKLLAVFDKPVLANKVILTGGITAAVPLEKGDQVEVVWPFETLAFSVF